MRILTMCAAVLLASTSANAEERFGIGLTFTVDTSTVLFTDNSQEELVEQVTIDGLACDGPAHHSTLKVGDIIVALEGVDVRGVTFDRLIELMQMADSSASAEIVVLKEGEDGDAYRIVKVPTGPYDNEKLGCGVEEDL